MDLAGPKLRTAEVRTPDDGRRLHVGDSLFLTRLLQPGPAGGAFQATCTCPDLLGRLEPGHRVLVDDGRIQSRVESAHPEGVLLRVFRARPKGEKLRSEKSLNFPDTALNLVALTDKDRADIPFIARIGDIVGYSFVQDPEDLDALIDALAPYPRRRPLALVAKIETARAVRNLPELIVRAAGERPFGVMIARGDLAVEIGFERLAEMQEEILWLCEAAHIPVIWATQVLENFAKNGIPSRAEMTDAAMSERAECVMLNKGPFILDVVAALDHLLKRMAGHQLKKTPQLRALSSWPATTQKAALKKNLRSGARPGKWVRREQSQVRPP
jgi:pyruvate kinase